MITLIYAKDQQNVIGLDNKIPWRVKEDLLHLKNITHNQLVIIGYKTFLSMKEYYKNKLLPFKKVFLLSSRPHNFTDSNLITIVNQALFLDIVKNDDLEYFVIGGASIYNLTLPYANKVYETIIKGKHEGDVYLNLDLTNFNQELIKETDKCIYYLYKRM